MRHFYSLGGQLFLEAYMKNVEGKDLWDIALTRSERDKIIRKTIDKALAYLFITS